MITNSRGRIAFGVLVTVAILGVTACGSASLSQVKQFGSGAAALGDSTRKAFDLTNTATIDRKIYDVAADPTNGPVDNTFKGLFTGDLSDLRDRKNAEQLRLRIEALGRLSAYGRSLQALAEADSSTDIDEAAKGLNGALVGLGQTYEKATGKKLPVSDADLGIIATAVDAIGKCISEVKRRDAIKTVIERAHGRVEEVAKLTATELGRDSELAKWVKENLANSRGSVQQAYNETRKGLSFDARIAMLTRARQLYDAEVQSPEFFRAVSQGAKKLGEAHTALKSAVENNRFTSAEIARRIGELQTYVESVKSFYDTVQPKH